MYKMDMGMCIPLYPFYLHLPLNKVNVDKGIDRSKGIRYRGIVKHTLWGIPCSVNVLHGVYCKV